MEDFSFGEPTARVEAAASFPLEVQPTVTGAQSDARTQPSSQHAPSPNFAEIAAKVLDLKGLGRPTNFDGREVNWPEWKFSGSTSRPVCWASVI